MSVIKTIALEGVDKAGKFNQSKLLAERLKSDGYKVIESEFHRYDTITGKLVMDWLTKKWDVDQTTIELIMTADKQAQQNWFNQLEKDGYDFLVLDRYMLSQLVYSVASGVNLEWTRQLQAYMRRSDIDIVIDIPAEVSMKRKGKHNNGANDKYESDFELLSRVRDNYITISEKYSAPLKHIVDGTKTIEEIHEDIYSIVIDNLT